MFYVIKNNDRQSVHSTLKDAKAAAARVGGYVAEFDSNDELVSVYYI